MTISGRPYQDYADLQKIQAATAEWIASAGFLGYVNVSDIALRLFMGMRRFDPREIVRLWEDAGGDLVGWSMAYPVWNGFEALIHPDYRQNGLAAEILDWAEHETARQMAKSGLDASHFRLDVYEGDTARIALLEQRGYARREQKSVIAVCPLDEAGPRPRMPDGFTIRSLQGEQDAGRLVDLVNDSFGWKFTADAYREVMRSPGYDPANELVAVAPDGRFASSCILLPDTRNRTGMFENVGTAPDFRQMGLAKNLLLDGMQRMKAHGFTLAMVPHLPQPGAASALYASAGFQPTYPIFKYARQMAVT